MQVKSVDLGAEHFGEMAEKFDRDAKQMQAPEGDKYEHNRKLAVYHLRQAARLSREIDEAMDK